MFSVFIFLVKAVRRRGFEGAGGGEGRREREKVRVARSAHPIFQVSSSLGVFSWNFGGSAQRCTFAVLWVGGVGAPAAQRKNARERKKVGILGGRRKTARNVGPDRWTAPPPDRPTLDQSHAGPPPLSAPRQSPFPSASPPPQKTNTPNLRMEAKVAQNKGCKHWSHE